MHRDQSHNHAGSLRARYGRFPNDGVSVAVAMHNAAILNMAPACTINRP